MKNPLAEEISKIRYEEFKEIKNQLSLITLKLDNALTMQAVHAEKFKTIEVKFLNTEKEINSLNREFHGAQKTAWGAMLGLLLSLIAFVLAFIKG